MGRSRGHEAGDTSLLAAGIERLSTTPVVGLIAAAILLLSGIGYLDAITGANLSLGPAYQVPVLLAATAGRRLGVAAAALASGTWTAVQLSQTLQESNNLAIPAWNLTARFLMLWLVAVLYATVTTKLAQERQASRRDFLTGLPNRRAFHEATRLEVARMRHNGSVLTVAFVDVDNFKAVNDRYGHAAGDELLSIAGRNLAAAAGPSDVVARIGGDEFAVLLPGIGKYEALQRLRALHAELTLAIASVAPEAGFSIGAVTFTREPQSEQTLLDLPDRLMYQVKQRGKGLIRAEHAEAMSDPGAGNASGAAFRMPAA